MENIHEGIEIVEETVEVARKFDTGLAVKIAGGVAFLLGAAALLVATVSGRTEDPEVIQVQYRDRADEAEQTYETEVVEETKKDDAEEA